MTAIIRINASSANDIFAFYSPSLCHRARPGLTSRYEVMEK